MSKISKVTFIKEKKNSVKENREYSLKIEKYLIFEHEIFKFN